MKQQILSFLALVMMALLPSTAMGAVGVRVVFNRGTIDAEKVCGEDDWVKVGAALQDEFTKARRLGEAKNTERELQSQSAYCLRVCSGFPAGMCWRSGTGCTNRRELQQTSQVDLASLETPPDMDSAMECNRKQSGVLKGLNGILRNVNDSCRKLIMTNHWLQCYYGV